METSVVPSNEMETTQPANPETGEGHNQPEETGTEHVISIRDSFEERFRKLMKSDASVEEEDKGYKPFIGQVPTFLREKTELKTYFYPRIVSFGPVHHDEKGLEQGQQFKHRMAELFIRKNVSQQAPPAKSLYEDILNEIARFKECYGKRQLNKFNKDDEELAWMFFVDGCALFGILLSDDNDIESLTIDHIVRLLTDFFLLENQLPLGVLNLVMEYSRRKESLRMSIHRLAEGVVEFEVSANDEKADSTTDQSFNDKNHLLELVWTKFVKKEKGSRSDYPLATSQQFRSVKDLQVAGIILEPNNSSNSLRDISFNRGIFFRKLKIPRFSISEQKKFIVFNLIAFEMHPNFKKDRVVTSYICFLRSLVATKEDVAELRKAGILFNYLLNDEEVLKIFQEFTSSLKPYPDIFSGTKNKVISYLTNKHSMTKGKWLSEAMQVYFRSPWTTIGFVSATFLLILTII